MLRALLAVACTDALVAPRSPARSATARGATAAELRDLVVDAEGRGRGLDGAAVAQIREIVADLEAKSGRAPSQRELEGRWRVLATISPPSDSGDNFVRFFSVKSWVDYAFNGGPSPVQSLVAGSSTTAALTQKLTLSGDEPRFDNVVDLPFGRLVIRATVEPDAPGAPASRLTFRFRDGEFLVDDALFGGALAVPYPVPFDLLGDRAVGYLETTVLDEASGVRVARGNKGTTFVFERASDDAGDAVMALARASRRDAAEGAAEFDDAAEAARNAPCLGSGKAAVVLCPAQFSGPRDYGALARDLRARGHAVYACRLTPLKWLTIVKSVPTRAYFAGELEPSPSLDFYLEEISAAFARAEAATPGGDVALLAHSIGGWVARAWLGGDGGGDDAARERCGALVMLGTPNLPPPAGTPWAKLDQTRGLLTNVNARMPGAHRAGVRYTSVASNAVDGGLGGAGANSALDRGLAFGAYLPLCGDGNAEGDGITPAPCALLPGTDHVLLDDARHFDFLPNPLGLRAPLLGAPWYGSDVDAWVGALEGK